MFISSFLFVVQRGRAFRLHHVHQQQHRFDQNAALRQNAAFEKGDYPGRPPNRRRYDGERCRDGQGLFLARSFLFDDNDEISR